MGRLEAQNLVPATPKYDPKTNFRKLRVTWGWVPWEEPIGKADSILAGKIKELPVEGPVSVSTPPEPPKPAAETPAPSK